MPELIYSIIKKIELSITFVVSEWKKRLKNSVKKNLTFYYSFVVIFMQKRHIF